MRMAPRARIPCWCSPAASPPTSRSTPIPTKTTSSRPSLSPRATAEAQAAYEAGKDSGAKKPGTGIYAISYGVGEQALGNATLTFGEYDFTAGSRLEAVGSFQNIGDVGLRGSEANPITVKLMLNTGSGDPVTLATWEINENIPAGQTVSLVGTCDPLTQDLPKGSIFYFDLSEDKDYFADGAFSGGTNGPVLTVADRPELGFELLPHLLLPAWTRPATPSWTWTSRWATGAASHGGGRVRPVQLRERPGRGQQPGLPARWTSPTAP